MTTSMTTREAFLHDIITRVSDDAPRLIYADWLADHGGQPERADLIRTQIRLAKLPKSDPAYRQLAHSERRLLRHRQTWLQELGLKSKSDGFTRGFVEEARMSLAVYLRRAKRLSALTPLRALTLWNLGERMPALAACPYLASIQKLDLFPFGCAKRLDDTDLCTLARSEHVRSLRSLSVQIRTRCTVHGYEALLSSSKLAECIIDFSWTYLGPALGELLGRTPALARYTVLDLTRTDLANEGLVALLRSNHLDSVAELRLDQCKIGDAGIQALVQSRLPALRRLDLSCNNLSSRAVALLADSHLLCQLTHLDLNHNHIDDYGTYILLIAV